jgi:DNA-binding HxlR family transcriptional regulator
MKLEKITSKPRRYDDACGTAHALDLVGERWALLVMRELMLGPRRFGDLKADLPGISANVLTQRLEGLEAAGVVRRRKLPPPASVQVYELTDWGRESEPVILGLGRWGARSPSLDPTMPLSAVSMMLSLRAMFDPARAGDIDVTIAFRRGDGAYWATIRDGQLTGERGEARDADVTITGTPGSIVGSIYGFTDLAVLEREGAVTVEGDRQALAALSAIFELPEKAAG